MNPRFALYALATLALLLGAITVVGALASEETTPFLPSTSIATGALLLLAAWQIGRKAHSAVPLLWASAAVYLFSIMYPAFTRHGAGALGALIPAFDWSLALRVSLPIAAHIAIQRTLARERSA